MKLNKYLLGSRLRIRQLEYHLTVTQAAKEIGISKSTLSRLNRELIIPDVETYYKCCDWLCFPMDYFFTF
jgi:transcriptional regulator with XRE-family HTH domain